MCVCVCVCVCRPIYVYIHTCIHTRLRLILGDLYSVVYVPIDSCTHTPPFTYSSLPPPSAGPLHFPCEAPPRVAPSVLKRLVDAQTVMRSSIYY